MLEEEKPDMKRYLTVVAVLALLSWPILAVADGADDVPEQVNWTSTPAYLGTIEQIHGKNVVAELKKALSDVTQSARPSARPIDFMQNALQELARIGGDE